MTRAEVLSIIAEVAARVDAIGYNPPIANPSECNLVELAV